MFPSFFNRTAVSAIALTAALNVPVIAQEITARMDGSVVGPGGAAISGATVRITHTGSGTTKTTSTDGAGGFNASGLRVGGPYTVTVSAAGHQSLTISDVFLDLDRPFNLNATLAAADAGDEIVVTAAAIGAGGLMTGVGTNFSSRDIANSPSIARDLKDTIRRDPLVSIDPSNSDAIEVGGSNNRYNSFTVDGVKVNDDFGLNNGGYPTQRSPVSIDMVEQVSVLTSPFSVEYGGFKGATLNAVTKSGENEFHGSLFYFKRDEEYSGETASGAGLSEFEETVYGMTLSGPIIKDKLFFSLGYDFFEGTEPSDWGPAGSGKANESDITAADLDAVAAIALADYGFDAGDYEYGDIGEEDEKIFAKIDWNVSDYHRAVFSYQYNQGNELNPQHQWFDDFGLSSHHYNKTETLDVWAGHFYSDWTDSFSTEIKISKKDVTTSQDPLGGREFAAMEITVPEGVIYIGPDQYRHSNALANTTWQTKFKGTYNLGDHSLAFGWERESIEVFNLFVQHSQGTYEFASIADFDDQIASDFTYNNAYTNDDNDAAAEFDYRIDSLFIMDTWDISDTVTIEYGLRYERYEAADTPALNANFLADYGFGNNATVDGLEILMPRAGFNWSPGNIFNMDRISDFTLRGGIGLFSGGNPNVWISNTYTNDGVTIVGYSPLGACAAASDYLEGMNGYDIPTCVQDSLVAGDGNVDLMDPEFEIPSEWKVSLGIDFTADLGEWLGDDWNFTFDALFTDHKDPVLWKDLTFEVDGYLVDGRPYFDDGSGRAIMLTNGSGGGGRTLSFSVQKYFDSGWDVYMSYANQDMEDLNPGTSSTSTSNFGKYATSNANDPSVATSNYNREHRVNMAITYEQAFFGDLLTTVSLYGEYRTGRPYSYTFDGSYGFLGDTSYWYRDRELLYVPTGVDDTDPNALNVSAELMDYINSSELSKYKGMIAPRNAFNSPDYTKFDLKFSQELPGIREQDRTIFTVNIENIGNMLNDEWGHFEQDGFHYVVPIVNGEYDYFEDKWDFDYDPLESTDGNHPRWGTSTSASVWKVQFGIKYQF